jgi:hypothetical protein
MIIRDKPVCSHFLPVFLLLLCLFLFSSSHAETIRSPQPLSIQVYATAGQVSHLLGTPPYSVHALGPEHFAVCSFTEDDQTLKFRQKGQEQPIRLSVLHDSLDRDLRGLLQARLESGGYQTILPAWEVMVFQARQQSK